MKIRFLLVVVITVLLAGCYLSPGMHFAEANKKVDGVTTRFVSSEGLQYRLRIVPITRKILYQQKYATQHLNQPNYTPRSGIDASSYNYRIRPNDVLGVTLWESADTVLPALSNIDNLGGNRSVNRNNISREVSVPVDGDGYIYFPFAGEVYAKGLSASDVRRKMQNKMKEYFDEPKVSVRILEHKSQFAMVTGQVNSPGKIPIESQPVTVVDSILAAGGLKQEGFWKQATLSRSDGQKIGIDLHRIYIKGDLSQNYRLRHGDVLHVPVIEGNTAYLYKDSKATSLLLQNNTVTLTEAIGNTGGLSGEVSNSREIFVLRREEGRPFEEVTAYHLNAKSPAGLVLANSFFLRPKDIIYIETSNLVRWSRVIKLLQPITNTVTVADSVVDSANDLGDN